MDERGKAFAAALESLYKRYPVKSKYAGVERRIYNNRDTAIYFAKKGDIFAVLLYADRVSSREIESVYTLLYS
jgi:hypothetical protein